MKKLLFLLLLNPAILLAQSKKERKAKEKNDKQINLNLRAEIAYLADDKLEGRRTGSHGEQMASEYMADLMAKAGLEPKGTNGFYQEFVINEGKKAGNDNFFQINNQKLTIKDEFIILPFSPNVVVKGNVSPSLNEMQQPWFVDIAGLLEENKGNPHFDILEVLKTKAFKSANKGATALIIHNSSLLADNILFDKNDTSALVKIPVVYLKETAFKKYFADAIALYKIDILVSIAKEGRKAKNVVGYINNNAANTVIIGAHYDHLGRGEDGSTLDMNNEIHNGADDNASGSAALIELARLLKQSKAVNNNYLFIAFSGEELGLLGSKYWLEHPSVNVVPNYMVNMDMVGRYDSSRKLTVGGFGTSPVWANVVQVANTENMVLKLDSSGSGPSDHSSFYRRDIPVLFFFTNSHSDYHKATDDADKINYEAEVQIINYIYTIIDQTNNKGKLAFLKTREAQMGKSTFSVSLGVLPDYAFAGTGVRIEGVSKGRAAEKAGLQAGDVLLQLGAYKFVDVMSYMEVLGKFKKGDTTKLTIKRGGEQKVFDIVF